MSQRTSALSRAHLLSDGEYLCEVFQVEFKGLSERFAELAGGDALKAVTFSATSAFAEPLRVQRQARYVLKLGDGRALRVQPVALDSGSEGATVTALVLGDLSSGV